MLRLLVLRTQSLPAAKQFYETLGLCFTEEQHGSGPRHFAATVGGSTFELYPSAAAPHDGTRLGFAVHGLGRVLDGLASANVPIIRPAEMTPWGRRAVVRDPDGRAVELYEEV